MRIKAFLIHFVVAFAVAFVINAVVIFLFNLIRYGEGAFNWGLSFYFGIVCGILFAILLRKREATGVS